MYAVLMPKKGMRRKHASKIPARAPVDPEAMNVLTDNPVCTRCLIDRRIRRGKIPEMTTPGMKRVANANTILKISALNGPGQYMLFALTYKIPSILKRNG